MEERHLLLAGLFTVCAVSTVALARLLIVLRIFRRRQQRWSEPSINQYSTIYSNSNAHTATTNMGRGSSGGGIITQQQQLGGGDGGGESRILLPSLLFHVLLFLCLVTEVPVYAVRYVSTLHSSGVGRPLYALHLCSYLLLFCAFCVIVTLWSDVAVFEPNEWTALMNR